LTLLAQTAHGSITFINRVLASFHANTPTSVAALRTARATADWPAVAAVAHKLRPSLRLLGAVALVPWLRTAESQTSTGEAKHAAAEALAAGLDELLQVLPREVQEMNSQPMPMPQ
jgi:HPt (histidine-containing phosphotransfer) domain-containing protein